MPYNTPKKGSAPKPKKKEPSSTSIIRKRMKKGK